MTQKQLEKFVKTWVKCEETGKDVQAVADIMGMSREDSSSLAGRMRNLGVELPHFKRGRNHKHDWDELIGVLAKAKGTTVKIEKINSTNRTKERAAKRCLLPNTG